MATPLPLVKFICFIITILCICFCKSKPGDKKQERSMATELAIIGSLLRNIAFAESMAKTLDSSYYAGVGEPVPEFLTLEDDTATIFQSPRNEKIATNLAGFYALECGVDFLSTKSNSTPVEWLEKISGGTADTNAILLLNRLANATWKASQPFRDLKRINRPIFTVASSLSMDEVGKDYFQVRHAAKKLLSSMKDSSNKSASEQRSIIRRLIQDTAYAVEMASFLYTSYDSSYQQSGEPFITTADNSLSISKKRKDIKIATSIAGFYALECGLNYLMTTKKELPSTILRSLLNDSMSTDDKMVFARFANATWKTGQPFRDLKRITRATFTPFFFLNKADIEKDMVQIRAAAARLLQYL